MSAGEDATLRTERPQLGRTFAMTLVSAGYGTMTAGLIYLVFLFMRAGDDFRGGALVPAFAAITAVVAAVGLVSLSWSGARRRPWFWLVSAIRRNGRVGGWVWSSHATRSSSVL